MFFIADDVNTTNSSMVNFDKLGHCSNSGEIPVGGEADKSGEVAEVASSTVDRKRRAVPKRKWEETDMKDKLLKLQIEILEV